MGIRKMGITVTAGMNAPELVNQYYTNEHKTKTLFAVFTKMAVGRYLKLLRLKQLLKVR